MEVDTIFRVDVFKIIDKGVVRNDAARCCNVAGGGDQVKHMLFREGF